MKRSVLEDEHLPAIGLSLFEEEGHATEGGLVLLPGHPLLPGIEEAFRRKEPVKIGDAEWWVASVKREYEEYEGEVNIELVRK